MSLGDREFTSEEVATFCGVTRVTVAEWIARGRLDVRWTAGGHRRVPRESLAGFMRQQGYAMPRCVESRRALVLCVAGDPAVREQSQLVLESTGDFEVESIAAGPEALLRIGLRQPDAVLIDTRAIGFDHRQAIEAIRAEAALEGVVIIALTGLDEEASLLKRFGADGAVSRPRGAELPDVLSRVLSERQRRAAPGDGSPTIADELLGKHGLRGGAPGSGS